MAVFLIDPFSKTVSDVQDELDAALEADIDLLEFMRVRLSPAGDRLVRQVSIIAANQDQLAIFVDNFGMLKGGQEFWRFAAGGDRIAGKAMMFAVDPESGRIAPLDPAMVGDVEKAIVWEEDIYLLRVHEQLLTAPGEMPVIARIPVFNDDPHPKVLDDIEEARSEEHALDASNGSHGPPQPPHGPPQPSHGPPQPSHGPLKTTSQPPASQAPAAAPAAPEPDNIALDTGWIVRSLASGSVQAVRYVLESDSIRPATDRLTADNLADLRAMMPAGYERQEPDDDAAPDILELWVLAHHVVEHPIVQ
jgi:hypothetical protein